MKFNEKLIELRKKAGLSQEELGYKLNVTRQTVSKWELGQTTPEMDKLVEMSKIFNVSVDELTNDSEITTNVNPIIEDKPIQEKSSKSNKFVIIIVALLIIVIVGIIGKVAISFMAVNKFNEFANQGVEQEAKGFFAKIFELISQAIDEQGDVVNKIKESEFNSKFEFYTGSKSGLQLKTLLDEINTNNKKEERKITVKYNDTETQDTTEIKNLKMEFNELDKFEISFEYDNDGYIYEVTIEKYENDENNDGITETINNAMDQLTDQNIQEDQFINDTMNQIINQNEVLNNQMNQFMNDAMNQFNN